MKKLWVIAAAVFTMSLLAGCGGQADKTASEKSQVELHVAAAASLTDAMREVAAAYNREKPDVKLVFNFGSSGALQQAIENGGATDLFFSAAQKQMDALEKAGLLEAGTRRDLFMNEVVLVVPAKDGKDLKDFSDLARDDVQKVAVGGRGVPVGQYTEEILTKLDLLEQVAPKEVLGSDVRQVLAWVSRGEADAGVVYATDAAITQKVRVAAVAPAGTHQPVVYPAAVLRDSKVKEEAKAFLAFAAGGKAKEIFAKYGFKVK